MVMTVMTFMPLHCCLKSYHRSLHRVQLNNDDHWGYHDDCDDDYNGAVDDDYDH